MNYANKLRVTAYAIKLQLLEIYECLKNLCYAERIKFNEEYEELFSPAQKIV